MSVQSNCDRPSDKVPTEVVFLIEILVWNRATRFDVDAWANASVPCATNCRIPFLGRIFYTEIFFCVIQSKRLGRRYARHVSTSRLVLKGLIRTAFRFAQEWELRRKHDEKYYQKRIWEKKLVVPDNQAFCRGTYCCQVKVSLDDHGQKRYVPAR